MRWTTLSDLCPCTESNQRVGEDAVYRLEERKHRNNQPPIKFIRRESFKNYGAKNKSNLDSSKM
ncbi:MAG: hypothetical protein WB443_15145 [Nitrososphaeraceae archaeon]